jgi:hypothetical protein
MHNSVAAPSKTAVLARVVISPISRFRANRIKFHMPDAKISVLITPAVVTGMFDEGEIVRRLPQIIFLSSCFESLAVASHPLQPDSV